MSQTHLWTSSQAATATGGFATTDWVADGVSIDTRTLQPGDLFVALKAARDGHDFVAQALASGAAAALVSHVPEGVASDAPFLIVDDVLEALQALGVAARSRCHARVVAVTGSVGKTSTKEMLRAVLEPQGRTHASVASYNNHWGVPLTLARMPKDTDFAIIEIGMNHPGEIAPLARMTRPHVALITTVAAVHLEAFENVEDIAREKASVVSGLEPGGMAVLNADMVTTPILMAAAEKVGANVTLFGEAAEDWRLSDVTLVGNTTVAKATIGGAAVVFKIQTAGRHFAMNALGALAAVDALGADIGIAAGDLARWVPFTGRGARENVLLDPVEIEQVLTLLDDAYNANPTSLEAALDVLAVAEVQHGLGRNQKGRRIAFVGDMKELGSEEAALHAAIAQLPSMQSVDVVHAIGPLMRHLYEALPVEKRGLYCETSAEMAAEIRQLVDAGDCVLVKGSLSMRLALIVDAIRKLGHPAPQATHEDT